MCSDRIREGEVQDRCLEKALVLILDSMRTSVFNLCGIYSRPQSPFRQAPTGPKALSPIELQLRGSKVVSNSKCTSHSSTEVAEKSTRAEEAKLPWGSEENLTRRYEDTG